MALFIQTAWLVVAAAEVRLMFELAFTVSVPLNELLTHGPVVVTVYEKLPDTVGVPLMVNTPPLKLPLTPAGNAPAVIVAPVPPPAIE